MSRKFIAFDIETAADIPGTDFNWRPHRPIGITCAAALASDNPEPVVWHARTGDALKRGWLSVREALELPEPDTSWMDKPIPRKNFAAWLSS